MRAQAPHSVRLLSCKHTAATHGMYLFHALPHALHLALCAETLCVGTHMFTAPAAANICGSQRLNIRFGWNVGGWFAGASRKLCAQFEQCDRKDFRRAYTHTHTQLCTYLCTHSHSRWRKQRDHRKLIYNEMYIHQWWWNRECAVSCVHACSDFGHSCGIVLHTNTHTQRSADVFTVKPFSLSSLAHRSRDDLAHGPKWSNYAGDTTDVSLCG